VRRGWGWVWWGVGVLAGLAALLPAHWLTAVPPISRDFWADGARTAAQHEIFRDLGVWWGLFAVTAVALLHAPRRAAVAAALVLGTAAGLVSLVHTPVLSDDLYRYAWDGRVQAAGTNPYRYPPDDPALAGLRDDWLWPSAQECAAIGKNAPCTRINRPGVPTIYPPGAQLWFRVAHRVLPAAGRELGYEVLGLLLALATGLLVVWVLRRTGRDPRWVVLWACCPLVPVEAVQSAHVDVLAGLLVTVSAGVLLGRAGAGQRPGTPGRGRSVAAALVLALAGLVKLYPFVLVPGLLQRRRPSSWAAAGGLAVLAYLPYVLGVGGGVAGYLQGYLHDQGYGKGTRFLLLSVTGLTGTPVKLLAYGLIAAVFVLALLRRLGPPEHAALAVLLTLLFVATPGEAWYGLVLLPLVALTGSWQWLGLFAGEYVSFLTALLGGPHLVPSQACYLGAVVLGAGVTALKVLHGRLLRGPGAGVPDVGRRVAA
jgi:glycosyl transferase family 87